LSGQNTAELFIRTISTKWLAALRPPLDTPGRQVAAGVAVVAAVIFASFAYDQAQRYKDALALADRDTRNASVLLAENAARTFESIGETLRAVASLQRDVAAGVYTDKATIHDLLKAIEGGSPVVRAVGWTDVAGNRVASSLSAAPPPLDIASQEQFAAQRDGIAGGLYVAAPVRSGPTGDWTIGVSRPLAAPDGRFAGIAFGVVDPGYFAAVFRSIELGPSRVAVLLRGDGVVMAREPADERRLGQSVGDGPLFRESLPRASVGTFHGQAFFDGSERIVSYARVPGTAQIVAVSIARADALATADTALKRAGARFGFTLLVLFVGAWLLVVQLRRRQRADGKFRDLLEAAPDAMVIVDEAGRIALVNAAAERLFGHGRGEMLGRSVEILVVERHRADYASARADFFREPRRPPTGSALELAGLRKDGTEFPLEISLAALTTETGVLVSGAIRDITARKRFEAELAGAKLAAEAASRAKSDFLSRMSHELRTPLNAVIGFAQMLQMDGEHSLTPKQRDYADYIITGGHHLLDLVNEVLDLAGIESGRLRLSIERVAVRDVLEAVHGTMMPLAQRAGVTFETRLADGVADVRADDLRLRQVLINLIANAIKYNRAGGTVTLAAESAVGERVRFAVADTGIGIAAERHKDIFQPFQRLGAEYTAVEGTGIGLALAHHFVEAMAGTIGFVSEPGRGSIFWVELPAEAPGSDAAQAGPSPSVAPRARAGGFSLLYVEDNPANLRLMEHLMSTLPDVAMLSAPTPQLGLELAVAHRPDVIVLDLNLPGMSGFEILSRLKALSETREIPVIALSAAAFPRDVRRGLEAGFFRYVTKPIEVDLFLSAVDAALADAPARRAATG
jgi:PAS domain S-box-containing protein